MFLHEMAMYCTVSPVFRPLFTKPPNIHFNKSSFVRFSIIVLPRSSTFVVCSTKI